MRRLTFKRSGLMLSLVCLLLLVLNGFNTPALAADEDLYNAPYYNAENKPLTMMGTQAQLVGASETYLAWYVDNANTRSVFGYDRVNKKLLTIGSGPTSVKPVFYNTTLLYIAGNGGKFDLNVYDLATNQQRTLVTRSESITQFAADGNLVAYTIGKDTFARSISAGSELKLDLKMSRASSLLVSGTNVFWAGQIPSTSQNVEYALYLFNMDNKTSRELVRSNGDFRGLIASGNLLAFIAKNETENIDELTVYDFVNRKYQGLGAGGGASISGNLIVYLTNYTQGKLRGYDFVAKRPFQVTDAATEGYLFGTRVIWRRDFTNSQGQGRAYYEAQMLPRPDPNNLPSKRIQQAIPNTLFFYETGHSLRGVFQKYWEKNGGLSQFGYPLTEEFDELNQSDGNVYKVQYYERARFEYHPENKPPYDVLLGLLGTQVTIGREYEEPFLEISREKAGDSYYFQETGHATSGSIRTFWEKTGGLPVYGFPISEPFMELNPADGKTYLVQYFERNRLEYHPENVGTRYEVQLGLLASQILASRGWLGY